MVWDWGRTARASPPPPAGLALGAGPVGVLDHSFGGSAAVGLALAEPRVSAVCVLDGSYNGPANGATRDCPALVIDNQAHTHDRDPTLDVYWHVLTGWRREFRIANSYHMDFTDFRVPAQALGLVSEVNGAFGTIDPARMTRIPHTLVRDHVEQHLRRGHSATLDETMPGYPELIRVR